MINAEAVYPSSTTRSRHLSQTRKATSSSFLASITKLFNVKHQDTILLVSLKTKNYLSLLKSLSTRSYKSARIGLTN